MIVSSVCFREAPTKPTLSGDTPSTQAWRRHRVLRLFEDASVLAKDLSGGSTDELAYAVTVQEKCCAHMVSHGGVAAGLCHLQLSQYKHFIGNHSGALHTLTASRRNLGTDMTAERIMSLQLSGASLQHLGRFEEAVSTFDEALALLPGTASAPDPEFAGAASPLDGRVIKC